MKHRRLSLLGLLLAVVVAVDDHDVHAAAPPCRWQVQRVGTAALAGVVGSALGGPTVLEDGWEPFGVDGGYVWTRRCR